MKREAFATTLLEDILNSISIAIVDDHPLFREGVSSALSRYDDLIIVAQGESAADALVLAATYRPAILLLDITIPGGGAIEAIRGIIAGSPETKVVMLTASEEIETLASSFRHGASGYVVKGVGLRELAQALRRVANGARYISPLMSSRLAAISAGGPRLQNRLTKRERDIIWLVVEGLINKQIALRLNLQEKTIKHHMTNILKKLGVTNRTEAALRWRTLAGPTDIYEALSAGTGKSAI